MGRGARAPTRAPPTLRLRALGRVKPSAGEVAANARSRSAVMRMKRNEVKAMPCDEALFVRVVKAAFNQRRKTLSNALKGFPALPAGVPQAFAGKRAEQLSVQDFIALTLACEAPR